MDFDTAPEIKAAIMERAELGAYGYAETNSQWEEAYRSWWKSRYNFEIKREWLFFATGVVPLISSTVRKIRKCSASYTDLQYFLQFDFEQRQKSIGVPA